MNCTEIVELTIRPWDYYRLSPALQKKLRRRSGGYPRLRNGPDGEDLIVFDLPLYDAEAVIEKIGGPN